MVSAQEELLPTYGKLLWATLATSGCIAVSIPRCSINVVVLAINYVSCQPSGFMEVYAHSYRKTGEAPVPLSQPPLVRKLRRWQETLQSPRFRERTNQIRDVMLRLSSRYSLDRIDDNIGSQVPPVIDCIIPERHSC
jgi:hypothetical protein